jgi:hypothetical protein
MLINMVMLLLMMMMRLLLMTVIVLNDDISFASYVMIMMVLIVIVVMMAFRVLLLHGQRANQIAKEQRNLFHCAPTAHEQHLWRHIFDML